VAAEEEGEDPNRWSRSTTCPPDGVLMAKDNVRFSSARRSGLGSEPLGYDDDATPAHDGSRGAALTEFRA
jgi:hypothetical protein